MVSNVVGALPAGPTDTSEQIGGLIRAQAGLFVPGSGSGDKVPIMAEPKEYVLNKNAVAALGGERALDNLNFNVAPRFGGRMALNEDPLSSRMSGLYYATGSPELDELLQKMREKEEERKAKKSRKKELFGPALLPCLLAQPYLREWMWQAKSGKHTNNSRRANISMGPGVRDRPQVHLFRPHCARIRASGLSKWGAA